VSTGCGRKRRAVRVWRSRGGVQLKPKAVNKPLHYFIVHELDKPGSSATVSLFLFYQSPILLSKNISHAIFSLTVTRKFSVPIYTIPIIVT
jgi:hypothetical protein